MATLIRVHVQPEKLHTAGQSSALAMPGIVTKVEGCGPNLLAGKYRFCTEFATHQDVQSSAKSFRRWEVAQTEAVSQPCQRPEPMFS